MRGLRTKLELVKNNIKLLTPEPDVVILTETLLCQDIKGNELGLLVITLFVRIDMIS